MRPAPPSLSRLSTLSHFSPSTSVSSETDTTVNAMGISSGSCSDPTHCGPSSTASMINLLLQTIPEDPNKHRSIALDVLRKIWPMYPIVSFASLRADLEELRVKSPVGRRLSARSRRQLGLLHSTFALSAAFSGSIIEGGNSHGIFTEPTTIALRSHFCNVRNSTRPIQLTQCRENILTSSLLCCLRAIQGFIEPVLYLQSTNR